MCLRPLLFWTCLSAGACVAPTNPYDPDTPPEGQQPGVVAGTVFALRAPLVDDDGNAVTQAGPCRVGAVDGDHSGFVIALRRLGSEDVALETAPTNASGRFLVRNLSPGSYVLTVISDRFAVPPPEQIEIGIEQTVTKTICALDTTPPAAPVLDALPAVVGPLTNVALRILNPEVGTAYQITEYADGTASAPQEFVAADEPALEAPLSLAATTGQRVAWTVEVVAVDAMGNRSAPARAIIIRDVAPPDPPTNVRATPGRDRVFVAFTPPAVVDDDDGAASFLVSYAVAPRPRDEQARCRQGVPFDDTPDDAFFAVEGPSPLSTTTQELTVSGLVAGTEVYLYVAAVDAVGNVGCFADPVTARVDEVTFTPLADRGPGLENAVGLTTLPGSTLGALPGGYSDGEVPAVRDAADRRTRGLYAMTSLARTFVVDLAGVAHDLHDVGGQSQPGPPVGARDIDVAGDVLVLAGEARGAGTVRLDKRGVPSGAVVFDGLGDVRAVAGEPGLVLAAATTGLFANGVLVASGAYLDVALTASHAVAVRRVGAGAEVVVLDRRAAFDVVDAANIVDLPQATGIVGRALVVVDAAGVGAFEFGACLQANATSGCLVRVARRALPGGEQGLSVGALDDIALLGTAQGNVFALALPSLRVTGRITLGAAVRGLVADELGFCAAVDGVDDGEGAEARLTCVSTASFPVVDGEARTPTPTAAHEVVVVDGHAIAAGGNLVTVAPLWNLAAATLVDVGPAACAQAPETAGCDVADLAGADGVALVLRDDGVLLALRSGAEAEVILDMPSAVPGLVTSLGGPRYQGRVVATGSTALVVLAAPPPSVAGDDVPATLVRLALRVDAGGTVDADVVDHLALPSLRRLTTLGVHGTSAWLGTAPRGLLRFDVGATLSLASGSVLPDASDPRGLSFASGLVLVGSNPEPLVASSDENGTHALGRFLDGTFAAVSANLPAAVAHVRRAGRFAVATTLAGSAFIVDVADSGGTATTVLSLPSAASAEESVVSSRGLLVSDGDGGLMRLLLR
jgi:hypothetical protein